LATECQSRLQVEIRRVVLQSWRTLILLKFELKKVKVTGSTVLLRIMCSRDLEALLTSKKYCQTL
jgi:hypothetical protein